VSCVVAALAFAWGCPARLLTLLCVSPCACSALHFVAAIGNANCVKLLIDAGADINLQDKEGGCQHRQTLLKHLTHMHSSTAAILPIPMDFFVERCRMLACMCTPHVIYANTPPAAAPTAAAAACYCAWQGSSYHVSIECMYAYAKDHMSCCADGVCCAFASMWVVCAGYTPLHMASGYMHTGPMAALLEAGADPLIKDKQGGREGAGKALGILRLRDTVGCIVEVGAHPAVQAAMLFLASVLCSQLR
jgi:hypothetical protein